MPSARAEGIGVFPALVTVDDGLRGAEYRRTVGINNDSDQEKTWLLSAEGELASWLSLETLDAPGVPIDRINTAPHENKRLLALITVPADAGNGSYTGRVRIIAEAGEDAAGGANVSLGAEIEVLLQVTGTERLSGSFTDLRTQDVEEGTPLLVSATVNNTGNIAVLPTMQLEVHDSSGAAVGSISSSESTVGPETSRALTAAWDTSGHAMGPYTARVSVFFRDLLIGTKEAPFEIIAPGSLVRSGDLTSLSLVNDPRAGEVAKFVASFANTGETELQAEFSGELYRGDRLVGAIGSQELDSEPGETVDLEVLAPVERSGEYKLRGFVNYGGNNTRTLETPFTVKGPDEGWVNDALPIAAGALALGGAGAMFVSIRRNRGQEPGPREEVE